MLFIKDYTVFNPNFVSDVITFFNLEKSEEDVIKQIDDIDVNKKPLTKAEANAGMLTPKQKLNAFIDRVEFIGHLKIVSDFAKESKFSILKQEVVGLDWDIAALRLYLALSCIDIFCEYKKKHKEYFEEVFLNASDDLKKKLQTNICIFSSIEKSSNDLKRIANYLYDVRNFYTHAGKRFHVLEVPVEQLNDFPVGSVKQKNIETIYISKNFNLVKYILDLSIYNAKKEYGF